MENFNVSGNLIIPAIIVEILFPILLIIGYQTRFSALILSLFTLTLAAIFHTDFSNQMQLISFSKNIAIAGGFLIIFVKSCTDIISFMIILYILYIKELLNELKKY